MVKSNYKDGLVVVVVEMYQGSLRRWSWVNGAKGQVQQEFRQGEIPLLSTPPRKPSVGVVIRCHSAQLLKRRRLDFRC